MKSKSNLALTSDPAGDILSSAAAFKSEAHVTMEYVVNSLEYTDPGVSPKVQVNVFSREKMIEIHDNGMGMDEERLAHFFRMHSENIERKQGKPGRGKFGTGKSAAFGIGNRLTISTRRNGVLNTVELSREVIEAARGEDHVPVNHIKTNIPTDEPNGTSVTISDIQIQRIKIPAIIDYIERHLRHWKNVSPQVAVNDHLCSLRLPEVVEKLTFEPEPHQKETLGDVSLTVNVSRTPLEEHFRGVAVTAGPGNLVGVEDAGVCSKEHGNFLFGEIDVPSIETFDTSIEPYDDSRSLELNPMHPVVQALLPFIGTSLEKVRKKLAQKAADARKSEQARRLSSAADRIANALNEDFRKQKDRLDEIRSAASRGAAATSLFGGPSGGDSDDDLWTAGTDELGEVNQTDKSDREGESKSRPDPKVPKSAKRTDEGEDSVSPAGGQGNRRRPSGGFKVVYAHLGEDSYRSFYDSDSLKILINLDHKVVRSALESCGVEDPAFQRLSYEIAFSEYSLGLGVEMVKQDPDMPADDLLYEVRSTLNRISEFASSLYK